MRDISFWATKETSGNLSLSLLFSPFHYIMHDYDLLIKYRVVYRPRHLVPPDADVYRQHRRSIYFLIRQDFAAIFGCKYAKSAFLLACGPAATISKSAWPVSRGGDWGIPPLRLEKIIFAYKISQYSKFFARRIFWFTFFR